MLRIFIFIGLLVSQQIASAETHSVNETLPYILPQTTTFELKSELLGRTYPVYVSVPRGYTEASDTKYPVVVLNDGPYAFPVAAGALDVPMSSGVFEEVILVGIGFSQGDNMMLSRIRDYSPSVDLNWKQFKPGQAKQYLEFIEKELLPFVENRFSIDSKKRTLVGHSAGGLFGTYVLLNKPELFESYVILSPALFWGSKLMFAQEKEYATANIDLNARVYFAVGTNEKSAAYPFNWLEDQHAFVKQLSSRKYSSLKIKEDVIQGGVHQTTFPIGFIQGMQWLFAR